MLFYLCSPSFFRQLKMFRLVSKLFCCVDGPTPRSSGVSEFSNYTDTVDYVRKSPRNKDRLMKSKRFLSNTRLNELNESSSTSTVTTAKKGANVEMCDFILITVKKEEKFT